MLDQQQALETGEKVLVDDAKSALSKVDALLKWDLRKMDSVWRCCRTASTAVEMART